MMFTAAEYGFEVAGIEKCAAGVKAMQAMGFQAMNTALANLRGVPPFQVISMCDVIEHSPDPALMIEDAWRLLLPGGLLLLSCPNRASVIWRALDLSLQNSFWGEIEHVHNFTRARLESLIVDHGFKPLHYAVSQRYRASMDILARKVPC